MTFPEPSIGDGVFMKRTVEAAIRIGVIAGLIAWCFMIARPFLIPIIWGAIIAVAVFHGYDRLQTGLGGRRLGRLARGGHAASCSVICDATISA